MSQSFLNSPGSWNYVGEHHDMKTYENLCCTCFPATKWISMFYWRTLNMWSRPGFAPWWLKPLSSKFFGWVKKFNNKKMLKSQANSFVLGGVFLLPPVSQTSDRQNGSSFSPNECHHLIGLSCRLLQATQIGRQDTRSLSMATGPQPHPSKSKGPLRAVQRGGRAAGVLKPWLKWINLDGFVRSFSIEKIPFGRNNAIFVWFDLVFLI